MEGRRLPPKASHPFPNMPDMSKYWGQFSKAHLKASAIFLSVYGIVIAINLYLTRHEKGPFGTDIMTDEFKRTPEEERFVRQEHTRLAFLGARVTQQQKPNVFAAKLIFDDRIVFDAPSKGDELLAKRNI